MSKDNDTEVGTSRVLPCNEIETSTPINSQVLGNIDHEELHEHLDKDNASSFSVHTRHTGHSILKNTYTPFNESSLSYKGNIIPPIPTEPNSSFYSVANDVSRRADLQPTHAQKVVFSPTKEIVSYGNNKEANGFQVDVVHLERQQSQEKDKDLDELDKYEFNQNKFNKTSSFWQNLVVDPRVPYVLSLYLQLFFNCVLVSVVLYLLYLCISTVQEDVRHKIEMYTSDAIQEITLCTRQFYGNKCSNDGTNKRAPALEQKCMALEKCMNRNAQQLGKSKITAETFAEIVNGFLHPISWKSAILFTGLVVASVFVINTTFGTYRSHLNVQAFAQVSNSTKRKELETVENERTTHKYTVASTPPNPPFQKQARVTDESTLPFSSPLSRRTGKS